MCSEIQKNLIITCRHTWFYCVLLYSASQDMAFFCKSKVGSYPVLSKSIGTILPTASAHFVSLSRFGNSCNVSNFFIVVVFVMVICDQWLRLAESLDGG